MLVQNTVTFQGTIFQISVPVEIDENTARLMSSHSYGGQFIITNPEIEKPAENNSEPSCCD